VGPNAKSEPAAVDRDDDRPLHVQIRDILQDQISSGRALPGSSLPTEVELQQQFGVSRSVVRQALSSLADLGLIHRQRGRGSVVAAAPTLRRSVQRAGGLGEQASTQGQHLRTHVLAVDKMDPPPQARIALGTSRTTRIERIRYLEDIPVAYMTTWVASELFPNFTTQLLQGNSLLAMMRALGYTPAGGPRQFQAVAADDGLAAILHVRAGDPLLLLEGVTRDESGRGLEWFKVWHRENTVFDVDAHVAEADTSPLANSKTAELLELITQLQSALGELRTGLSDTAADPTRRTLNGRTR
jgi:GntR family transcriptional regulator